MGQPNIEYTIHKQTNKHQQVQQSDSQTEGEREQGEMRKNNYSVKIAAYLS